MSEEARVYLRDGLGGEWREVGHADPAQLLSSSGEVESLRTEVESLSTEVEFEIDRRGIAEVWALLANLPLVESSIITEPHLERGAN